MSIKDKMKKRAESKAEGRPLFMREKKFQEIRELDRLTQTPGPVREIPRYRTLRRIKEEVKLIKNALKIERKGVEKKEIENLNKKREQQKLLDKREINNLTPIEKAKRLVKLDNMIKEERGKEGSIDREIIKLSEEFEGPRVTLESTTEVASELLQKFKKEIPDAKERERLIKRAKEEQNYY